MQDQIAVAKRPFAFDSRSKQPRLQRYLLNPAALLGFVAAFSVASAGCASGHNGKVETIQNNPEPRKQAEHERKIRQAQFEWKLYFGKALTPDMVLGMYLDQPARCHAYTSLSDLDAPAAAYFLDYLNVLDRGLRGSEERRLVVEGAVMVHAVHEPLLLKYFVAITKLAQGCKGDRSAFLERFGELNRQVAAIAAPYLTENPPGGQMRAEAAKEIENVLGESSK